MRRYANKFHFTNLQIDYLCFFESFSTQSGKSSTQSNVRPFTNTTNPKNTNKNTQSNNTNDVISLKDSFDINSKKKKAELMRWIADSIRESNNILNEYNEKQKELFGIEINANWFSEMLGSGKSEQALEKQIAELGKLWNEVANSNNLSSAQINTFRKKFIDLTGQSAKEFSKAVENDVLINENIAFGLEQIQKLSENAFQMVFSRMFGDEIGGLGAIGYRTFLDYIQKARTISLETGKPLSDKSIWLESSKEVINEDLQSNIQESVQDWATSKFAKALPEQISRPLAAAFTCAFAELFSEMSMAAIQGKNPLDEIKIDQIILSFLLGFVGGKIAHHYEHKSSNEVIQVLIEGGLDGTAGVGEQIYQDLKENKIDFTNWNYIKTLIASFVQEALAEGISATGKHAKYQATHEADFKLVDNENTGQVLNEVIQEPQRGSSSSNSAPQQAEGQVWDSETNNNEDAGYFRFSGFNPHIPPKIQAAVKQLWKTRPEWMKLPNVNGEAFLPFKKWGNTLQGLVNNQTNKYYSSENIAQRNKSIAETREKTYTKIPNDLGATIYYLAEQEVANNGWEKVYSEPTRIEPVKIVVTNITPTHYENKEALASFINNIIQKTLAEELLESSNEEPVVLEHFPSLYLELPRNTQEEIDKLSGFSLPMDQAGTSPHLEDGKFWIVPVEEYIKQFMDGKIISEETDNIQKTAKEIEEKRKIVANKISSLSKIENIKDELQEIGNPTEADLGFVIKLLLEQNNSEYELVIPNLENDEILGLKLVQITSTNNLSVDYSDFTSKVSFYTEAKDKVALQEYFLSDMFLLMREPGVVSSKPLSNDSDIKPFLEYNPWLFQEVKSIFNAKQVKLGDTFIPLSNKQISISPLQEVNVYKQIEGNVTQEKTKILSFKAGFFEVTLSDRSIKKVAAENILKLNPQILPIGLEVFYESTNNVRDNNKAGRLIGYETNNQGLVEYTVLPYGSS
ncbi:MAG: hypothetical protein ACK481_06930, partial [Candidatus Melainabacteria bacterium]